VQLRNGATVEAQLALAFTYQPAVSDVVLVIGDSEGWYVIGVLQGSGRAVLELPGDVELRASGGVLRLTGDKGVEVAGPEVSVRAGALRMIAGAVVQACSTLHQRVAELLSVHAGQRHTAVDGTSLEQARDVTILTQEKVTVNGKQIYLG
jgi:hypothetical protein